MANAVPVVQPDHGAFPELIEGTGGGVLVAPGSSEALAEAMLRLWRDPERRRALGASGQAAVHRDYSAEVMAERTLRIYQEAQQSRSAAGG